MPFYRSGLGNSAAYQVSGAPYIASGTSSANFELISFPRVTSEITISANSGTATFKFKSAPEEEDFILPSGQTTTLRVKCKEIYIKAAGTWSICAALTSINTSEMYEL